MKTADLRDSAPSFTFGVYFALVTGQKESKSVSALSLDLRDRGFEPARGWPISVRSVHARAVENNGAAIGDLAGRADARAVEP